MARFAGKSGTLTYGGATNLAFKSWEIDYKGEAIDVTGMDSSGKKEFIAGLTEWSGSISGFATGDVVSWIPGSSGAGDFRTGAAGSPKITGTVLITGLKVSSAVDGAVQVDVTFQGTGTATVTTV